MSRLNDNLDTLLRFAKKYRGLGDAVQSQLDDILAGDFDNPNPNAVKLIERELKGWHEDIDDALRDYSEANVEVDRDVSR